jgi:hypothetical protein
MTARETTVRPLKSKYLVSLLTDAIYQTSFTPTVQLGCTSRTRIKTQIEKGVGRLIPRLSGASTAPIEILERVLTTYYRFIMVPSRGEMTRSILESLAAGIKTTRT